MLLAWILTFQSQYLIQERKHIYILHYCCFNSSISLRSYCFKRHIYQLQLIYNVQVIDCNYNQLILYKKISQSIINVSIDALNFNRQFTSSNDEECTNKYHHVLYEFCNFSQWL
uniref:Uncharacterized protein n=1 Tax=Arundo donax TaxID=35708 RepID=A0A0A9CMV2_ARUDO